ncbi:MAG: lipopolysaccharide biosynthesis protein [Ktedonobacteraceae bacterium]|nr:lipopolysaccharide biosynthesis protein [Ktedonobacteraceae bacterium]
MDLKKEGESLCEAVEVMDSSLPQVLVATKEEINDPHFQTHHLLADLKNRTVSSGFITLGSQGIQFVLTLASTMALARLLTPSDFGLLAMVFTIMGFLRVFREAGLSTATVQREGITHAQVSNLFWINVAVSACITLLVAAAAPVVAWFYREPRLIGITVALSVTFLLAGLAVQHMALLNRQMRFKAIALIQVVSVLSGVLVGVGMAWFHYGYWSLVGLNVTTNMMTLLMTWSVCQWRPQSFTQGSETRSLINFGANLSAGSFVNSLARGLDGLLIGRFYGAVSVGLYSRAAALLNRPLEQFSSPVEAVFIPALSRLQTQPERYRRTFLRVYETIALTSFLFTGMFFALARPVTLVVLGPKWEGAAIIFAGFTFMALQYPLGSCASWLLTSQGRGRESFVASSVVSLVMACSFIAGLPFGPAGVAIAASASSLLIQLPIFYWLVGRHGPVRTKDLWICFLRHLPLWGVVCVTLWLIRSGLAKSSPIIQLAICVPAGLLAGGAFILAYPPARRVAMNLLSVLRELKSPA